MPLTPLSDTPASSALSRRHAGAAALLAVLAVVVLVLPAATLAGLMPGADIAASNSAFLHGARQEAMTDMLLLAELDAVVSVVRTIDVGVSLGVSANVEIGEGLSSLAQVLRAGIAAALFGIGFYDATAMAASVAQAAEPWALKLVALFGLIHAGAVLLMRAGMLRRGSRATFELAVLVFLVLRLALPYGIAGTAAVSGVVRQEIVGDARDTLQRMHAALARNDDTAVSLDGWATEHAARSAFERIAADFPNNIEATAHYATRRVAVSFIDGIALPVAFVMLFASLGRRIARDTFPVRP